MRLVIGGPARDTGPVSFAFDLAQLYAFTREHGPWTSVTMGFIQSTYVHVGRDAVLAGALQRQATHVLWLDTDMRFPADAAIRLARHDVPVVACNCLMRDTRMIWSAQRDGQRLDTTEASTGLEPVDVIGFGVLLMRLDVVAGLERPWFIHGLNAAGEDIGEDVMFCRKLQAAGHSIYIDHDLSKEVGHTGQYTYQMPRQAVAHA